MKIEAHTPTGKTIHIDLDANTVEIPEINLSGEFGGKACKLASNLITAEYRSVNATHYLRSDNKTIALTEVEADKINKAVEQHTTTKIERLNAELEQNIPGLSSLNAAITAQESYDGEFEAMMENEYNDGVSPPRKSANSIDNLCKQFPRASLYKKAESYACASHYAKAAAGRKAMMIIANGGNLDEARNVMNNWQPESTKWD